MLTIRESIAQRNQEKGIAEDRVEGRVAGREEGREKNQVEVVLRMLNKGYDLEIIEEITDMPIDRIKMIRENS